MASEGEFPTVGVPGADLGWTLGVILRSWHERVEQAVAGIPHGTRGFQILSMIGHNDPPTQSGLAKHLNIDKTVMPYIVDALEEEGLLERRVDAKDRRMKRIDITAKGSATLADLEAKVAAAEDDVFRGIDPALRAAFTSQAERLAVSLHAAQPGTDACAAVLDVLTGSEVTAPAS